jgi:predicted transcriptional regulator
MGTKQSSIARLESGDYNPTISFLKKTAKALNSTLKIKMK